MELYHLLTAAVAHLVLAWTEGSACGILFSFPVCKVGGYKMPLPESDSYDVLKKKA